MRQITYFSPRTTDEACRILKEHSGAKLIAGGTDIMVKWKRTESPDMTLVDVNKISGMSGITRTDDGGLWIGAATVLTDIADSKIAAEYAGTLCEAANSVGSVQIRNMATIGGNICNAAPSADTVLPMLVYEAYALVKSCTAERRVPINGIFGGPGVLNLEPGEIVTGFVLPPKEHEDKAVFIKHARRAGMDVATVGTAVRAIRGGSGVKRCLIAMGAVAPTPVVVEVDTSSSVASMAKEAIDKVSPISDIRGSKDYRYEMLHHHITKSLLNVLN